MPELEQVFKSQIQGDVHFDSISRRVYSVDASIYEIEPLGVVLPKSKEDILKTVTICQDFDISITPRGAATGISGGCIGKGVILDTSKYLNRILEIDYSQEYAICEPGVVQDTLNHQLASRGYRLGPDTSTGNRATIGGMVANNSAGARSLRYGKMVDHVEEVELILANGESLLFTWCSEEDWNQKCLLENWEGRIYREVSRIRKEYASEILQRFPKIPRRVSGYNLDELIKPFPLNLSKIIVGSEGSLGIISQFKVKIVKCPKITGLCIIHFHKILEGMTFIKEILFFGPLSLEMIDHHIISMGRQSPTMKNRLDWLKGNPQSVFVVEFEAKSHEEVAAQIHAFENFLISKKIGYAFTSLIKPEEIRHVWEIRKAGLELLLSKRSYNRAIAFIEDISVAPEQLEGFLDSFIILLKNFGKEAGIYGHIGSGCMHIRPYLDLRNPSELKVMSSIMEKVSDLILEHGGAMSGEHGDGLVRSWLNRKMFGDKLYGAFQEIKKAFDPTNRMNPGKVVEGQSLLEHLRLDPKKKIPSISTFLDFNSEGGFSLAIDLCNGNGLCRKKEEVMCPSFQVTGDEYDSTRARAQALRGIVNGEVSLDEFTSEGIRDILDLCIECKGCKSECPSHIDMTKIKSEFLYQYQEKYGYSLRNRLFAHLGRINQIMSPIAYFWNMAGNNRMTKGFLEKLGITSKRPLPPLTRVRFSRWVKQQPTNPSLPPVILFNDTFTEFHCPEIGQSAFQVLTKLGYRVIVPPWNCCGRTLLSKGFLKQGRQKAEKLVNVLSPYTLQGIPILGLEPSCILTIKDDFSALLTSKNTEIHNIIKNCFTIDEFLRDHVTKSNFKVTKFSQVFVHGHCHQKSSIGLKPTLEVLERIPSLEVHEIKSGCCGMAGSFGYESEHVDFSLKIAELKLFPAIRAANPNSIFIANGFSCRSQIIQGTHRSVYHLIQIIDKYL